MTTPEKLNGSIVLSVMLHGGLFLLVLFSPSLLPFQDLENWGSPNPGEGMNVKIVGSISGIALPSPEVVKEDAVPNESKGSYKSETAPTPPPPPENAEPIPDTKAVTKVTKTTKPAPVVERPSKAQKAPPPEPPTNTVPYGAGGQPALGYGQFASQSGGVSGLGDDAFGSKYSWYVQAMIRKISQNWLKGLVDSRVTRAPRVYMSFDIARDGTISNISFKQSSNIPTLDNSAKRALYASSPLPGLPGDYSGSKVSVTFYFEYIK